MATSDEVRPAPQEGPEDQRGRGAPQTGATDQGHPQDAGDAQGTTADDAEREQERQLADGTESPG